MTAAANSLAARLIAGDRRALARAITVVESTRPDHRQQALALLDAVMPHTGQAIRLGFSGPPGVGKSSFIETFGCFLTQAGHKVAVLAIDPSSARGGGSILGDKTRMEKLAADPNAFIRPSPSGGALGGVARRTRQALLLVEAAGFDVVIIETVGVGQSEVAVADMVDMFILLLGPGGGDELQGIKRGIMELADLIVVNKADGALKPAAERAAHDSRAALRLMRPKSAHWTPRVVLASALEGAGIEAVWQAITEHHAALETAGMLHEQRTGQALAWMWAEIADGLMAAFRADPAVAEQLPAMEARVKARKITPGAAAARLLALFAKAREPS
jgi:LAO/AO transport system kinase